MPISDRLDIGVPVMKGVEVRENKNGFHVVRLHYTACPEKATDAWKRRTQKGMPQDKWEQEYEINFNVLHGKRFYGDFTYEKHVRDLHINQTLPVQRGWDFGWHYPAVVWCQIDTHDRFLVYQEEMGSDEALINFGKRISKMTEERYKTKIKDFGDPSGKRVTETGEKSSVDILRTLGIRIAMRKTEKEIGFNIMRSLLAKEVILPDGTTSPAFLIDRSCVTLIDGFMGGYHFPEVRDGQVQKTDADGGGYYEHLQDAIRYILICLFKPDGSVYRNIRPWYKNRIGVNELTGY